MINWNFRNIVKAIFFVIFTFLFFNSCKNKVSNVVGASSDNEQYTLVLRWNKSYQEDSKQKAEIGLNWLCVFLGAELPKGSFKEAIGWNNNQLIVNFQKLGFHEEGLLALSKLIYQFKQSEEYKQKGAIDLGRFVSLCINSSNHYYAITGMASTFNQFKKNKVFDIKQFAATNSTVSSHDRIIDLPDSNFIDYKKWAYVSNECEGKISEGKTRTTSFEVKELMANGQFRFAIYDTSGNRLTAAIGKAGKPAKCLWCHESTIQTLFDEQIDEPNFYSAEMFKYFVKRDTDKLKEFRKRLISDINFEQIQDHVYVELLYISFMEPSAERLAIEWGISLNEVKAKLTNIPTHEHEEFLFLGQIYNRKDVEVFSPYKAIEAPSSAREKSIYEPDLIK